MRAIALLLIIANVTYFGWAAWIDVPLESAAGVNDLSQLDLPGLVLARERANSTATTPQKSLPLAKADIPVAAGKPRCTSVGPFQDLPTAAQAAATLKSAGFGSEQRLEQGEMWVGYWLSLQDLPSRDEADRALVRLKERGIADAYIIPGSDPPNVVSLGVFKDHDRAQRRLNEIQQLGLPAQISDRKRAGSVYWLDVQLTADQGIDLGLLGAEPGKILRLEIRACPQ
jgi:hypothetical protein